MQMGMQVEGGGLHIFEGVIEKWLKLGEEE